MSLRPPQTRSATRAETNRRTRLDAVLDQGIRAHYGTGSEGVLHCHSSARAQGVCGHPAPAMDHHELHGTRRLGPGRPSLRAVCRV